MLQKIKDMMQLKEQLDSTNNVIKEQIESFQRLQHQNETLTKSVEDMRLQLAALEVGAKDMINSFSNEFDSIRSLRNEMEAELSDLKLFKSRLSSSLKDDLMKEFRQSMRESTERINADVQQYNELKTNLASVTNTLTSSQQEIEKFNKIASHLKEKDFALEKYAKKLLDYDKNKVELQRKVDSLQRLIGKERRRS